MKGGEMTADEHLTKNHLPELRYVPGPRGLEILNAAGIRMSKTLYYEGLRNGQIPNIRVGRLFYVREDIVAVMGERQ